MKKYFFTHSMVFWVMLLTACIYVWMYRSAIFESKILFPSNFLAQFYSPWVTQKFTGWEAGIPHKPIGTDQIRFFYPSRTFTNDQLAKNEIPLWNPYVFAGNAHAADVQSAVWYPLNGLYALLPQLTAWQLLVAMQSVLAFVFMFMYVRLLTSNTMASWVSAIAFGLSGFFVAWSGENMSVGHAGMWLPLVLWAVEKLHQRALFRYVAVGSFALTASLLAGFFQLTVYLYGMVVIYGVGKLFQSKKVQWSTLGLFALMISAPIGFSAISLMPSFEAYTLSPRATSDISYLFHTYLLPITHLIQTLSPDVFGNPGSYNYFGRGFYHETVLYIGLVPMLFVLFAIKNNRQNWYIRFFLGISVVSFFLTQDNVITRNIFQLPIPLLSTFLPSRILYLTTFALSVLAGFGFDLWQKDKKSFPALIVGIAIGLLSLCVVYAFLIMKMPDNFILRLIHTYTVQQAVIETRHGMVMLRNVMLSLSVCIAFYVFTRNFVPKAVSLICVVFMILFGQLYTLHKYTVIGEREFLYPAHPVISYLQTHQGINRFISVGSPILGNISTQYKLYSAEGLDPMFSARYGELAYAAMHRGVFEKNIPRIEVELSSLNDHAKFTDNLHRLWLLNLLGVRHIAYFQNEAREKIMTLPARFPKEQFIPLWHQDNWYVFENVAALPRAQFVYDYVVQQDSQKILDILFDSALNLSDSVVLEEHPKGFTRVDKPTEPSRVDVIQYEPTRVELSTSSMQAGILFLSDSYHGGWRAFIDGQETKIYRANYAFRAVVVPQGDHRVVFEYMPQSFVWGYSITKVSIVVFILIWVIYVLWYNNERKRSLK